MNKNGSKIIMNNQQGKQIRNKAKEKYLLYNKKRTKRNLQFAVTSKKQLKQKIVNRKAYKAGYR